MTTMAQKPRPPYVELSLRNPSEYERAGFVVRRWKSVAKALGVSARSARVARVVDPNDPNSATVELLAQVDRLVPHDRSHDQLVFKLDQRIGTGDEHYKKVSGTVRVSPATANAAAAGARVECYPTGVKLINQYLEVWLNTSAVRYPDDRPNDNFYAGAVTSVILQKESFWPNTERLECLDALQSRAGLAPHPEARAMQIDRIHLVRPPWDERRSVDVYPFREPWGEVSHSAGPVRAVVTVMSSPFEFRCKDVEGKSDHVFECNVFRALSLYDDADWIGDEIWVNARDLDTGHTQRLWFTARLFMLVELTSAPELFKYPDHPGWFCLTPPNKPSSDPWLGYAFATDAFAGATWSPPLDYRDELTSRRAFSWELGTSRAAHCVHKFRCKTNALEMGHDAGWLWYDLAFKRIRGTLAGEN